MLIKILKFDEPCKKTRNPLLKKIQVINKIVAIKESYIMVEGKGGNSCLLTSFELIHLIKVSWPINTFMIVS